jgi:hypothetical protein
LKLEEVLKQQEEDNNTISGLLRLREKAIRTAEDDDVELTEFQMKSKAGLKNLLV